MSCHPWFMKFMYEPFADGMQSDMLVHNRGVFAGVTVAISLGECACKRFLAWQRGQLLSEVGLAIIRLGVLLLRLTSFLILTMRMMCN